MIFHLDLKEKRAISRFLGVIAGALVIWLAAEASAWWSIDFGGIISIRLSPFDYEVTVLNQSVSIPLIDYLVLAYRVITLIAGLLLIISTVKIESKWSKRLKEYGWRKIPNCLAMIFIVALIFTIIISQQTAIVKDIVNLWFPVVAIQSSNTMFLSGSTILTITLNAANNQNTVITVPVTATFTMNFLLAIIATALCIAYRVSSALQLKDSRKA
ncbi:MAG: hypothetical protein DRJ60_02965 [Thermoprotei archaeon]|nr:MAG: hypothetical protein DRJ60_02965 [Thermoprotei archaeon]